MANIKCEFCGLSINPTANTHDCSSAKVPLKFCNGTCEDIGSIFTCEKHTYFSTGANPPPHQGSEWSNEPKHSGDSPDVCSGCSVHKGALTPLGEALQANCPRCNMRWIVHNCPQYPKLLDAKEMIIKLARGAVLKETAENADFFTSIKKDGEEFNVYVNENKITK